MKKIIGCIVLLVFLAGLVLISISGFDFSKEQVYEIPKVSDINLSEKLVYQRFGLFYYDGANDIRVDEDNINIDTSKPMVIYTHGMVYDTGHTFNAGFPDRTIWQNAGYNVFVFRWSPFADDVNPISIEKKEWSGDPESMFFVYEGENGRTEERVDVPQFSLAEVFGIFYNEFMTKYNVKSPEIRIMGHSMGGQLTMAIASYVKTMVDSKAMNKKFMFSRVTMLDPFTSSVKNDIKVDWLDKTLENGSAKMVVEVAKSYTDIGIPVEYISSGYADVLVSNEDKDALAANTVFIRVNSDYITGTLDTVIARRHQVAVDWYNESLEYTYMDKTASNLNYGVAPSSPTVFAMAQLGGKYAMENNITSYVSDDIIYSTNLKGAMVMGYAFYDENKNGLRDDTFASMREGITVGLYKNNKKIATTTTNRGGYYKFELDSNCIGENLEIRVKNIRPTIIVEGEGFLHLAENGIKENKRSEIFVLENSKQVKVINIGIK